MHIDGTLVRLVLLSREEVLADIEAMSPADRAQVSPDWLARLRDSAPEDPWTHSFAVVHRESGIRVGSCGFKGAPLPDGSVEIAYGTDADQRGRGFASAAVEALVAFAFNEGRVRLVRAHTLAEPTASSRVLTRCGFRCLGEVHDPEDGTVWRWERARGDPGDRAPRPA